MKVAIIGAGFSGLRIAQILGRDPSVQIAVYEKSRGVGGRLSSRRDEQGGSFDHGAPLFVARDQSFRDWLNTHNLKHQDLEPWPGKVISIRADNRIDKRIWFEPHWLGVPSNNAFLRNLVQDLRQSIPAFTLHLGAEVLEVNANPNGGHSLQIKDLQQPECREEIFDWVISSAPAPQTLKLFQGHSAFSAAWRESLENIRYMPCFSAMLACKFSAGKPPSWIAAKVDPGPIDWIFRESTKPGRDKNCERILLQTKSEWSQDHLETPLAEIAELLCQELAGLAVDIEPISHFPLVGGKSGLHRWRYAHVAKGLGSGSLVNRENKLALIGDGLASGGVEAAFISAASAAAEILQ